MQPGWNEALIFEDLHSPSRDYLKAWYPDAADGQFFKIQVWRRHYLLPTDPFGWPPVEPFHASLENLSNRAGQKHLARYRWCWRKRAVRDSANDYSSLFELVDAANIADPDAFVATMEALVDAEQWMRGFAGPLHFMPTPTPGAANVIDHPPEVRLLSVTLDDARNLVLTWTAVPGLTYRVQFKQHLTDPDWTDLPGAIAATGTIASQAVPLPTGARQGFLRVALLLE